jgi:hypothetical protein
VASLPLIAPVTLKSVRLGVAVNSGEPLFCVRDHGLEHDGVAFFPNANTVAGKTEFLRQPHGLAVAVAE